MRRAATYLLIAAAFATGLARGQDRDPDLEARLAKVRREVKIIDLDTSLARVPAIVEREGAYSDLLERMQKDADAGKDITPLLERGYALKQQTLADLNDILKLHRGEHTGLSEQEVWTRLRNARFTDVHYRDEWLVNILDDLEEAMKVNIEMDARVYKFDVVSFDFPRTTAKAMLQTMADNLLFEWIIRGDTLYVYKERHEVLFDAEWLARKRAAWRARRKEREEAARAAEEKAAEGGGG